MCSWLLKPLLAFCSEHGVPLHSPWWYPINYRDLITHLNVVLKWIFYPCKNQPVCNIHVINLGLMQVYVPAMQASCHWCSLTIHFFLMNFHQRTLSFMKKGTYTLVCLMKCTYELWSHSQYKDCAMHNVGSMEPV